MRKLAIAASVMTLALSANVFAADIEAGKAKSAICATCHGADGKSPILPSYPKLAGQNAEYLVGALIDYKTGARSGGMAAVMKGQTAPLSQEDMENLAAYYASLK